MRHPGVVVSSPATSERVEGRSVDPGCTQADGARLTTPLQARSSAKIYLFYLCNSLMKQLYFNLVKTSPSRSFTCKYGLSEAQSERSCTDLSTALVDKRKTRW